MTTSRIFGVFSASRPNQADPEKGPQPESSRRPLEDATADGRANNEVFTEDDGKSYNDDSEGFHPVNLDEEQHSRYAIPKLRADDEETLTPGQEPGVGPQTTTVTSLSSPTFNYKYTPSWLSRLKSVVQPSLKSDEIDEGSIPNYRYTPIISGIVIPFSILLEIPGLTEHWYIRTFGTRIVEIRKNPIILDVAMAISMACALVANIALVVRFLEKRVERMTIICVIFLSIHGLYLLLRMELSLKLFFRFNQHSCADYVWGFTPIQ